MSSSRAYENRQREHEREAQRQQAVETIKSLGEYLKDDYPELAPLPDVFELAEDGTWATWRSGDTHVQVRGLHNLRLSLYASWVGNGNDGHEPGPNRMYAPKDYDYLPWIARDVVRVLEDHRATLSLGRDYIDEDTHRETVKRTREQRERTRELLDRTA